MKIYPVGAELFHADWHDEGNSRLSWFCEHAWQWNTVIVIDRSAYHFVSFDAW